MPRRRRTETSDRRNPIHDAIAQRAYELYLDRGRADGHAVEDWLKAEAELAAASARPLVPAHEKK
jgi:hypothetical protein